LLKDHHKINAKYKSLKPVKHDLDSQLKGASANPYHLSSCIFSSPERMLQSSGKSSEIDPEILKLPAYINWAEEGKTTMIKYQGKCRSCYAFSGLASVESAILIK
jgi:C1A family cysteine protease